MWGGHETGQGSPRHRSCVKWGSTNTGWHINAHHVKKLYTRGKHNGDMGMGHQWWDIYGLMGGTFMAYNGWGI